MQILFNTAYIVLVYKKKTIREISIFDLVLSFGSKRRRRIKKVLPLVSLIDPNWYILLSHQLKLKKNVCQVANLAENCENAVHVLFG